MKIITLSSDVNGLWSRLVLQLIGYSLGFLWYRYVLQLILFHAVGLYYALLGLGAGIAIYLLYSAIKDHPRRWQKEVQFDFEARTISVLVDKQRKERSDLLDTQARIIAFDNIEQVRLNTYDSFLSSSYYRISVLLKAGEEIPILALKSASTYTRVVSLLNEAGITAG